MSERDNIFARIREALAVPAPSPGASHQSDLAGTLPSPVTAAAPLGTSSVPRTGLHNSSSSREAAAQPAVGSHSITDARNWLPQVGGTFEARLELFRRNALGLKADFHLVDNLDQLAGLLVGMRETERWRKMGSHSGQLASFATTKLGLPLCTTDNGYAVAELERCDVGISECDALIAQTGSVLVTNRSAGGRALSVLPPHHVVLARREQLLADLPEAFGLLKRKYAPNYPSFISLITGPSRTGDIERILVLGAHGPRKLTILCV